MSLIKKMQVGSSGAWKSAPTRFVDVDGLKFAYRELGPDSGTPVIFLNHLAAELDRWDPRVIDGIAARPTRERAARSGPTPPCRESSATRA